MKKKEIRKLELEKRMQLSNEELQFKTNQIGNHFNQFRLNPVQYLLSYYPIKERNEFDVAICERIVREKHPAVVIAWPKIVSHETNLEAHAVGQNKLFIKNKFNILEPLNGDVIPPGIIDIVFVPLLAFNNKGYRVGYGKGFYDRYLPACRPDVLKIGFTFFDPVNEIEDINEFDVPLNLCITPTCIYEF